MIDRDVLAAQFRTAVMLCAGILLVPLMLVGVSWVLASPMESGGAGSGTADPVKLAVLGVMALSPLVSVPLLRRVMRQIPAKPRGGAASQTPEAAFAMFAIAEYALWEIASLMGFVGFVGGATWVFFAACIGVTYVGFFISFPRLSVWQARADEMDSRGMFGTVDPS